MMTKIFAFTATALLLYSASFGQGYVESALLFSRTSPGGSARIQGIGGTQVALGGDFSSAFSNPAGLGMYNRSEFSLTPSFSAFSTDALYLGTTEQNSNSRLSIPGLGLVLHSPKDRNGFLGGSFGITLNRVNDFNRSIGYNGVNNNTSIIDYFIDDAFGATTAQFNPGASQYNTPTGLAYFNYLIGPATLLDPTFPDDEYFSDVFESIPAQQEIIETSGFMNQWSFSYGGNYNDKIFFGGGVGFTTLRYNSRKTFRETFTGDPYLNNLELAEDLDIRGSGINVTLGLIARPVDYIQVGISFVTPTFYQLSESYNATMNTSWKNFDYYDDGTTILNNEFAETDIIISEYNLTTPAKLSLGAAFISQFGFISADVEFSNPAKARYTSDIAGISFQPENDGIGASYQPVMSYRLGAEFRHSIFRFRGGYALQGDPYSDNSAAKNTITSLSVGAGIRLKEFFVDFALVNRRGEVAYQPYTFFDGTGPIASFENRATTGLLTIGFNF